MSLRSIIFTAHFFDFGYSFFNMRFRMVSFSKPVPKLKLFSYKRIVIKIKKVQMHSKSYQPQVPYVCK